MPTRTCERCDQRMPPFVPRKRVGDDLCCPACASGRPGGGNTQASQRTAGWRVIMDGGGMLPTVFPNEELAQAEADRRGGGRAIYEGFDERGMPVAAQRESALRCPECWEPMVYASRELGEVQVCSNRECGNILPVQVERVPVTASQDLRLRPADWQPGDTYDQFEVTEVMKAPGGAWVSFAEPWQPVEEQSKKPGEPVFFPNRPYTIRRHTSLRKGAPFAGYDDFDDCVAQNSDKDDPSAYCGSIKNKVEGQLHHRLQANLKRLAGYPIQYGEVVSWGREFPNQRAILAYLVDDQDRISPAGAIIWNDSKKEVVTVVVLDYARKHGIARGLFRHMDSIVGFPVPDDGYRTPDGEALMKALNRPEVPLIKQVSEFDANRPTQGLFWAFMHAPADDPDLNKLSVRRTAGPETKPFIGEDAWILVDDNLEPLLHPGSKTFYWPQLEADEAIRNREVLPSSHLQLPAREKMNPQNYEVTWASRHGERARWHVFPREGSKRVAHDSGDGETLYHCPLCGGGNIHARSDGTTWCEFCQHAFTVQVQPENPGMPQTINGEPFDIPDMPGEPAASRVDEVPSPEEPMVGDDEPRWVTSAGARLSREDYVAHLAIKYADDREQVVRAVRTARRRKG